MIPEVSIIIPVYNASKYIKRCMDSILSQTFNKIEVILVDDGSKDDSYQKCLDYSANNMNVYSFTKENSGPSATREFGVKHANGKWICFVDSDDALPPDAIEHLYNKANETEADIILGGWYKVLQNGYKQIRKICVSGILNRDEYINALLSLKCYAGPVGKIFKKELFDDYTFDIDEEINHNEDLLMNIHLALNAMKIAIYPTLDVYWYYTNDESITHQKTLINMWDKVMQELDKCLGDGYREKIDAYIATVVYRSWIDGLLDRLAPSLICERLSTDMSRFSFCSSVYAYSLYITSQCEIYRIPLLFHRAIRNIRHRIIQKNIYK